MSSKESSKFEKNPKQDLNIFHYSPNALSVRYWMTIKRPTPPLKNGQFQCSVGEAKGGSKTALKQSTFCPGRFVSVHVLAYGALVFFRERGAISRRNTSAALTMT